MKATSVAFMILFFQTSAKAQTDLPQHFTLDGRLFEPGSNTEPLLDSSTVVTIQVLNPAKDCVLYEEEQPVNTLGTNGYFSLRVGSPTGDPKRTTLDRNNSMTNVFYNRITPINGKTQASANCTYTPAAGEERFFRFFIKPSTASTAVQLSDDMPITSVPQALVAQTLQGLGPSDVFRTSVTSTQAKLDNLLTTQYTDLTDLASGTSTQYLRNDPAGTVLPSRATNPSSPTEGQIWFDNATNELKYFNGATVETVSNGSGVTSITAGQGLDGGTINSTGIIDLADSGVTTVKIDDEAVTTAKIADNAITTVKVNDGSITDAKLATGIDASKITVNTLPVGVVPTGTDDTKLPLVGGTMTGPLVLGDDTTFSGFDLLGTGHITMSPQKTITIGRYDSTEQPTLIASLGPLNAGAMWFNSSTGKLMYWSGAAAFELSESTSAGGDITAVNTNAGSGLSGGNTSGPITLQVVVDGTTIEIATNTIQLKALGVASGHLQDGSVLTAKLVDEAVTTAKIDDAAVTTVKIDDGAVNTVKIADEAVTTAKLADSSVSTSKLVDTSVTEVKLADGAVTTGKIDDEAVTSAKIADGTITSADVDTITIGKISSAASEYFTYMPNGAECTDGYVLKWTSSNRWECATDIGVTDHGALTGLSDDDHTQYALLAGRGAGQNLRGGTAASANLTLESTSDTTKGFVILQPTAGNVGIGTTNPQSMLDVAGIIRAHQICDESGLNCKDISSGWGGGGDIDGVTTHATTSGLLGGATSGTADLSVDTDNSTIEISSSNKVQIKDLGVASGKIADDAITSAKIDDDTIMNADINSAAAIAWSKIDKTGAAAGDIGAAPSSRTIATSGTSGLSGGGDLTADRSLSVNVDNTTVELSANALRVKDSSITSAKIADGTIVSADVSAISIGKISNAPAEYFTYMPAGTECTDGYVLKWTSNDRWECASDLVGATDHGALTGLGDDDHTQYVLLAGRTTGQNLRGGTAASANLTLESTSDATKGYVLLQPSGGSIGIGTTAPHASAAVHIDSTTKGFLPPRMNTAQRSAIASPNEGLIVFDTDVDALYLYRSSAWVKLADSTEVAFSVRKTGNQALGTATNDKVTWETEVFDVGNSFDLATERFQPTVAGKYLFVFTASTVTTPNTGYLHTIIAKNGSYVAYDWRPYVSGLQLSSTVTSVVDLNGSTDYVEFFVNASAASQTMSSAAAAHGFLISGGTGAGGGGAADHLGNHVATQNLSLVNNWLSGDGNNEGLRIDSTGQVGVGTSVPNSLLTVEGAMTLDQIASDFAGAAGYGSIYAKTDGKLYFRNGTGAVMDLTAGVSFTSAIRSGWPDALYCTQGSYSTAFYLYWVQASNVFYKMSDGHGTNPTYLSFNTDGTFSLSGGAGTQFDNSDCETTMAANISAGRAKYFGNDIRAIAQDADNDTKIMVEKNTDEDKIRFDTAGSERMIISETGRVGIGSTAPNALLDVAGIIRAEQICDEAGANCKDISTGWNTDYVATTRAVNTSSGSALTGGGDLSADRNIAVNVDNVGIEINTNALRLKDGGVTSAKIADGTIVSADVDTISIGKISSAPAEYFTYMPAGAECTDGYVLKWTSNDRWECASDLVGTTDHGALTGLGDDDHTQYALLAGRTSGQTLRGGTTASASLTLDSTSDSTKGFVILNPTGGNVGVGTAAPASVLDVVSTTSGFLPPRMTSTQRDAIVTPPAGSVVFNSTYNVLEVFNGTDWVPAGQSIPNGAVMSFNAAACPAGWTTYSAAQDRVIVGSGGSYVLAASGGAVTATTSSAGAHSHGGSTGSHALTAAQMPVHSHGVSDPSHAHSVYDPGHNHATRVDDSGGYASGVPLSLTRYASTSQPGTASDRYGTSYFGFLDAAVTGIGIYGAYTGISIQNAGSGGSHSHTIASEAAHSHTVDTRQPYVALLYCQYSGGSMGAGQPPLLDALANVNLSVLADGQALVYNNSSGKWENRSIASTLGYTPVNRNGDTMTGTLNLPTNGLVVGTNQLTVSGGNVGIGTSLPNSKLHVTGATGTGSSASHGAQFKDSVHGVHIGGNDASSYSWLAGWASGLGSSNLVLQPTVGNVGVGTINPITKLEVADNNAIKIGAAYLSSGGPYTHLANYEYYHGSGWSNPTGTPGALFQISGQSFQFYSHNGAGVHTSTAILSGTGNLNILGAYGYLSDENYKKNIFNIEDPLDKVLRLRPVTFNWRNPDQDPRVQLGFIAQEVEKIFPETVTTHEDGKKTLTFSHLLAPMVGAIQELHKWVVEKFKAVDRDIASQNQRLQMLEKENQKLKEHNRSLETYLCSKDPTAPFCKK